MKKEIYNKIINGNSIEVLKELKKDSIDLVVTSPPYDDLRDYENVTEWNFEIFKDIANQLHRVLKSGGVVVWVVGDKTIKGNKSLTSFKQAIYFQEIGFNVYDVIIYEKTGAAPPHPNRYFNTFEYMFIFSKGKPKTIHLLKDKKNIWAGVSTYGVITRREKDGTQTKKEKKIINDFSVRTNIWKYVNGKGFSTKDKIAYKHPAIFPEKLVEDHILSWSNKGDVVLDPFGGSGTTGKVAEKLERKWLLIESVPEYCEIARKRLKLLKKDVCKHI